MKIIGVVGGSCSGKTSYIELAHRVLGGDKSAVLSQDNYYIDQSARFDEDGGSVNFDHPDALDLDLLAEHLKALQSGQSVEVPIYDFSSHTRKTEVIHFRPKPVVFVDGILILTHSKIIDCLDFSVFIECDESLRLERRVARDIVERGRKEAGVRKQFANQVGPMHDQFVEPSKVNADLVLSQEEYMADSKAEKILRVCKE